jgi:hypothetical protein
MEFTIPQSLKTEHAELHAELKKATKEVGKIGEAARSVAAVLHPHFLKSERGRIRLATARAAHFFGTRGVEPEHAWRPRNGQSAEERSGRDA